MHKRLPKRRRRYRSIFGEFQIERYVYGNDPVQAIQAIPLDEHLGLPETDYSLVLEVWTGIESTQQSFHSAIKTLERITTLHVPLDSAERIEQRLVRLCLWLGVHALATLVQTILATQAVTPLRASHIGTSTEVPPDCSLSTSVTFTVRRFQALYTPSYFPTKGIDFSPLRRPQVAIGRLHPRTHRTNIRQLFRHSLLRFVLRHSYV